MIELPEIVEPQTAYVANMRALWNHMPSLARQVDEVDEVDELDFIPCQPSRSGPPTCQLTGVTGEPVFLHSRYDPRREAEKWADGVEELARQQMAADENGRVPMCYFVDGFGLGYHIQALFERLYGEAFILVSERNIALLRTALEYTDYSEMLASDRLIFLTRANREEIFEKLKCHSSLMMMGVVFTHSLHRVDTEYHAAIHTMVSEYAAFLRTQLLTIMGNSLKTCENLLKNVGAYVTTPSIAIHKNRFSGCPAVVVSAGPSLGRNIEYLKEIRDRVVVIAVQTTLKPLLARGIRPDFVTCLDYHEVSLRFYDGLTEKDLHDIHLVAEPKSNWQVIDYYYPRGPLSLLGNEFLGMALREEKDGHDCLPSGCTVAHLAFYLAEYIGADPILFIGQDLGFTDHVYYSPGTALHDYWRPEMNRFMTIEMKEWERIARHRHISRKVPDIHGQAIYTDEQMFTYLQQFEKDFARSSARVIDTSEGGARKQGCQTMSLREAAGKYCRKAIEPDRFDYLKQPTVPNVKKRQQAGELVQKRIDEVKEFEAITEETISLVRTMLGQVDDQPALNKNMVRLDELRTRVRQRMEIYRMVGFVSQTAELHRFRLDRAIDVNNIQGKDRQRRQLQRDIGYVSELKKGCGRLLRLLEQGKERLSDDQ
ncbi:MAG: hypothetical protein BWY71_00941 [Planctomycetes bacterium ADurb.Bin412]|nr:MAG: hypothetical protein BWY71_00941 [Planctomycetes bacterium ADurb.Bin412]